jgi:hypothetical protein
MVFLIKENEFIIQALCQKVIIFQNGKVDIEGMIDGDQLSIFTTIAPRRYHRR